LDLSKKKLSLQAVAVDEAAEVVPTYVQAEAPEEQALHEFTVDAAVVPVAAVVTLPEYHP